MVRWALLGAFCLALGCAAQPAMAQRPFTLTIHAEAPAEQGAAGSYTLKAGSELFVDVHVTNVSGHKLALGYDVDSRTGVAFGHDYEVHDLSGNLLQKRPIAHPEI